MVTLVWWPLQGCSGSPLGSHGDGIVSLLTAPKADERLRPSDGAPQVCSAAVRSARPASSQGRAGLPAHLRAPGREPAALRRVLLLGTRPGTCRCSVNPGEVDEYAKGLTCALSSSASRSPSGWAVRAADGCGALAKPHTRHTRELIQVSQHPCREDGVIQSFKHNESC